MEATLDVWRKTIETNLTATYVLAREAASDDRQKQVASSTSARTCRPSDVNVCRLTSRASTAWPA